MPERVPYTPYPEQMPGGAPGGDYFNIQANPGAFGGQTAAAEEKLGGSLEQAGDAGMQAIIARQNLQNEIHASGVNTWLADRITDRYSEFSKLEGRAAIDALPHYKADINDLFQQSMQQAPSLQEKAQLAKSGRYLTDAYYRYGTNHADQQQTQWANKTATDAIETYRNQAIIAAGNNDPQGVAVTLAKTDDEVRKLYEQKGYDLPTINTEVARQRGQSVGLLVKHFIDSGDAQHGQAIFEQYKDQIDAKSYVAIESALKTPLADDRARVWTNFFLGRSDKGLAPGLTPTLINAVISQESRGDPSAVSPKGAAGLMQIMPATAREVALEMGLPYDQKALTTNPDYNRILGTQYLSNLLKRYDGNQSLALAAYNGGMGRVDDWIKRFGDPRKGEITDAQWAAKIPIAETRDYVGSVLAKAGGEGAGRLPDKGATVDLVTRVFAGHEQVRNKVLSDLNREWSIEQTVGATQRAELGQQVPDMIHAAESGVRGITLPEEKIRAVMPAAKAQQWIDEFAIASRVGDVMQGVRWASPDEVAEMQRDIESGQGALSTTMKAHAKGGVSGPGAAGAEGDDGSALYFRLRTGAARQLEQQLERRRSMLTGDSADPAAYVRDNPAVAPAAAALDSRKPETFAAYATATLAVQDHLGVPPDKQRLLPRGMAEQVAARWRHPDLVKPEGGQPGGATRLLGEIEQTAKAWGDHWPQVYGEIAPKLDPTLRVVAAGVTPPAGAALLNSQNVTEEKLLATQDASKRDIFNSAVTDALKPFARTLSGSQRDQTRVDYESVAKKLGAIYLTTTAPDATTAAEQAVKDIVGFKYDFADTYRIPKRDDNGKPLPFTPTQIQAGADEAKATLADMDIAPEVDNVGGLSPQYLKDATVSHLARDGVWMTSKGETGLTLYHADGTAWPRASDPGQPFSLSWQDLANLGAARAARLREMTPLHRESLARQHDVWTFPQSFAEAGR